MIVCIGTTPALSRTMEFDGLVLDGVNRAKRVHEYAAGKAVNAARAAATLGETAVCISPVGGAPGELFVAASAGFEHDLLRVSAKTRLCVTVVDRRTGTSTELIEESSALAAHEGEEIFQRLRQRIGARDTSPLIVVLSGSIARGLASDFYAKCVTLVREAGGTVILDASGEALSLAIAARPHVAKVNAGEIAGLMLGEDTDASACALSKQTGGWAIITRGKEPTLAAHADGRTLEVEVPAVEVVSAIGSGDSFAGGLAVGLSRGMPMEQCLALATASASANAMTADAAHFEREAVERLLSTIRVVSVKK